MILLFDVGNTDIKIGTANLQGIKKTYRIKTQTNKTADEYYVQLRNMIDCDEVKEIVIASVVPKVTELLKEIATERFLITPIVLGPGVKTGVNVKTDNPKEVGADLIAAAAGAATKYGKSSLIIDLGTATKYIYVHNDTILGVIISPGVAISIMALVSNTALLPDIEIEVPKRVLGTNTITCMQSGVTYGVAAQVDGLIKRIKKEIKNDSITVVATGGLSKTIQPLCEEPMIVDEHLVLDGLFSIYLKNQS